MEKGPTVPMDSLYPFGAIPGIKLTEKHLVKRVVPYNEI